MDVYLNTDSNIAGTEGLAQQVEATVRDALGHHSHKITRVEVHLSDVNSAAKGGPADIRCLMEARPTGHQPVAVSHQAATPGQAVDGAVDNLKRALEHLLGRLATH